MVPELRSFIFIDLSAQEIGPELEYKKKLVQWTKKSKIKSITIFVHIAAIELPSISNRVKYLAPDLPFTITSCGQIGTSYDMLFKKSEKGDIISIV